MQRKIMTHRQSQVRIFWALVRIMIAITSTSFFVYFLVVQSIDFINVRQLREYVDVNVNIIDWLRVNGNEEEAIQFLLLKYIQQQQQLYNHSTNTPTTTGETIDQGYIKNVQQQGLSLLQQLIDGVITFKMVKGNETQQLHLAFLQMQSLQRQLLDYLNNNNTNNNNSNDGGGGITWPTYFMMTDFLHNLRLLLLSIISRNVNYQRQQVAVQSVELIAQLYYREYLSMLRDHVLLYSLTDLKADQFLVIEQETAMDIYLEEAEEKLSPSLQSSYYAPRSNSDWKACNATVDQVLREVHLRRPEDGGGLQAQDFDAVRWYNCCNLMLHSLRPVRLELKQLITEAMDEYVDELSHDLALACVGIVLELLAAFTLVYQAIPVVMLYFKFTSVVRMSAQTPKSSLAKDSR